MIRKIAYLISGLILLAGILGYLGVRKFNNTWFKDRPNYLHYSSDQRAISFLWSSNRHGDYTEEHEAMIIPVSFAGQKQQFVLQFDTGAPNSMLYGKTLESMRKIGLDLKLVSQDKGSFVHDLEITLGGSHVQISQIAVMDAYGQEFGIEDSSRFIRLGTLGSDFLDQRITVIDFKNQTIQVLDQTPYWLRSKIGFMDFDFQGRRIMLPAKIGNQSMELLYDSGCSAFGLITAKSRFDDYAVPGSELINYDANRFGESLPIFHKHSHQKIAIGGAELDLKRVSFVDMYGNFQGLMIPFTRIGGWLGNKPFIESTLVLDMMQERFLVLDYEQF